MNVVIKYLIFLSNLLFVVLMILFYWVLRGKRIKLEIKKIKFRFNFNNSLSFREIFLII